MAQRSLVVDASVVVKWFSALGETGVPQAVDILEHHVKGETAVVVPDLLYYEVANALVYKRALPDERVQLALRDLFVLGLETVSIDAHLLSISAKLAREFDITVYDACYVALARDHDCPLVTANPGHQGRALGCQVIPIEEWRSGST